MSCGHDKTWSITWGHRAVQHRTIITWLFQHEFYYRKHCGFLHKDFWTKRFAEGCVHPSADLWAWQKKSKGLNQNYLWFWLIWYKNSWFIVMWSEKEWTSAAFFSSAQACYYVALVSFFLFFFLRTSHCCCCLTGWEGRERDTKS